MAHTADVDVTARDVGGLTSPDALMAFLSRLGYETDSRVALTPESIGLTGEAARAIKGIELLSEDRDEELRVLFVQPRSLTAKVKNELARVLGKRIVEHLLILSPDFDTLEFVLLDPPKPERGGKNRPGSRPIYRTLTVNRRRPTHLELKALRRFTWTSADGLDQFEKLRSAFEAAACTSEFFQNRGLFSDYFLRDRLRTDPAWRESPNEAFGWAKTLLPNASKRGPDQGQSALRNGDLTPVFQGLGFRAVARRSGTGEGVEPDHRLDDDQGKPLTAAFVYPWGRWLDGPDANDPDRPDENPGACVVAELDRGECNWVVVTNRKQWRLYGRHAHARATNFYEVDLPEALGDTDPNEAFRYWWLFFRSEAFQTAPGQSESWLDSILRGCREYAKRLGDRLKDRIFVTIFPHLAEGFLADRKGRLGLAGEPTRAELDDLFEATLTLLYRLLFLLYAESRDLLPMGEAPYRAASLKTIKDEVAEAAGVAFDDVPERLKRAYFDTETKLHDRLAVLFAAMDKGDHTLNVPTYNGGLFNTSPDESAKREQRIARFLATHKVPDRHLSLAIDRLSRDQDDRTLALVPIDYKSLDVRHLGSIYEGLLEFKLIVADEDKTTKTEKGHERYISLSQATPKRGRAAEVKVRKGEVYLSNDKADRKASGSYYTPDPIVKYIVAQTVGPVLEAKLDTLRPEFRAVRKTFDRYLANEKARPSPGVDPKDTASLRRFVDEKTFNTHKDLVERLFDLKTLDPAMGSGHFLVESVDFITDRLLRFLTAFPINPLSFALDKTRESILASLGQQGVTVDPAQLTDINLLKRNVLKRCIYGVDLNAMAVELAKVSLWLDAFTLGAPLSFLDHHLRCGNSLVGATFRQLKDATSDRLFRLDYGPLLRAIQHVLFVSKAVDATASEVADSARQYDQARQHLSGYAIIFDLLVAEHFGVEGAKEVVSYGQHLDLNDRDRFVASLDSDRERALVAQVEALSARPDRRFFHWEIEFPEAYFTISAGAELKPADEAGFDVIVGNPPYVRQEAIKPLKDCLKADYETYNSTSDLYVYFQEREIKNLKVGGRMGMIVANKWMRAGYGEKVRGFLQRSALPIEIIDFGHAPIFPDADTFPCILIASRRGQPLRAAEATPEGESLLACPVPRENWDERMDLGSFVAARQYKIPTRLMRDQGWSLEDPNIQFVVRKLACSRVPLDLYCGSKPQRGLLTGFNEAFVIDGNARERLIQSDHSCSQLIKPLLRGRDMERFRLRDSGLYLIAIPSSENSDWPWMDQGDRAEKTFKKSFPSLHQHLAEHSGSLHARQDQGRYWWELRSCDYMPRFDEPKIVWQEMAWFARFALDRGQRVILNTAYFLNTAKLEILAYLNSPLAWWYMWRTAQHGKDEVLRLIRDYTEGFPIPEALPEVLDGILATLEEVTNHAGLFGEFEERLGESLRPTLGRRVDLAQWSAALSSDPEKFSEKIAKAIDVKRLPAADSLRLGGIQTTHRQEQIGLLTRQLDLEKRLAILVADAYGLTREERKLLRDTRPPRDPLDVLEAKIRGKFVEDAEAPEADA